MDVGTGLAIFGTAKLVEKLLGPTAEYAGEGIQQWAKRRVENVRRIFSVAFRRIGNDLESEGAVSPRVLRYIFEDGSYCDDRLAAEYFGGVLAASRSGTLRDDRGAYYAALVARLSTYQLRSHYVFYRLLRNLFVGETLNASRPADRKRMHIYVPRDVYRGAMMFDESENQTVLLAHALRGLFSLNLIGRPYFFGSSDVMRKHIVGDPEPGIIVCPSPHGIELFLVALGMHDPIVRDFLSPELELPEMADVTIRPGSRRRYV